MSRVLTSRGLAEWRAEGGCPALSPVPPGKVYGFACNLRAGHIGPHNPPEFWVELVHDATWEEE